MSVRVVQITDVHLTEQSGERLYGVDTAESLRQTVGAVANLPIKPDSLIATGDIAENGSKSTYQRFRDIVSNELSVPVYTLPGNHDDLSNMQSLFGDDQFHCVKAARLASWGMIFVNSQVRGASHGQISA